MARYISRIAKYGHGIGEPTMALVNGIELEQSRKRIAQFQSGVLLNHEIEIGLKTFTFKGLADGVPPETRLSVFDTRDYQKAFGISDDQREEIEAILDSGTANVANGGSDFMKVEEIRAPKPFPAYDDRTPDEILDTVTAAGIDPDVAYAYEVENEKRPALLDAFVELGAARTEIPKELESLRLTQGTEIYKPTGELIVRA